MTLNGELNKRGEGFLFILNNQKVSDEADLQRISKLVIPPDWENLWICGKENGHKQFTEIDSLKRKQYRYHQLWNKLRSQTKFFLLIKLGEALAQMWIELKKDITQLKSLQS